MTAAARRWTVLLVDTSATVREALRWALEEIDDLEVVGEAADGLEALRQATRARPTVVILDTLLPRLDGFALCRALKGLPQPPVVVFLTTAGHPEARQRAWAAGGDAYAEKETGWAELLAAVRLALVGRTTD